MGVGVVVGWGGVVVSQCGGGWGAGAGWEGDDAGDG